MPRRTCSAIFREIAVRGLDRDEIERDVMRARGDEILRREMEAAGHAAEPRAAMDEDEAPERSARACVKMSSFSISLGPYDSRRG